MEGCRLLAEARESVEKSEMREWRIRHSHNQLRDKKKKEQKEKEKEEDKLERFFCHLYEFHNPVPNAPVFVPAELPPRYAINFVPALPVSPVASTAIPVFPIGSASTDYSVISSANFVVPSAVSSSSSCIGPTQ